MEQEIRLMKGNEAIAEAAIRCGCDAYFGYPITPQSEILEYLALEDPYNKRSGMVVLQAESEIAAINMVYGAAGCGKKAMTSSSSPGISLKQEGLSYIAAGELPCLVVNVSRGGPGLGSIQPGQADYFQSVKGGGHGDYRLIVLAPNTVQEQYDFVDLGFELAFKYRNPVLILSDGAIGQMMEKVVLTPQKDRSVTLPSWATTGKTPDRERNRIFTLNIETDVQENHNRKLQAKYKVVEENEIRYQEFKTDDAEYIIVAYGISSRICMKTIQLAREKGIKLGMFRPITLWPFPKQKLFELSKNVKGIFAVEHSCGQMVEDVELAVKNNTPVKFYGRSGGVIMTPQEVLLFIESEMNK
ncbi:MAG: 3-methyl-2-oxobutanoate dehydrogenase subunit VorB [Bacteroidales bacterium]|nr:3-methyl-2-oxobutanoate dehydrogenase subunit VorB [Bacteroidales bacterium]